MTDRQPTDTFPADRSAHQHTSVPGATPGAGGDTPADEPLPRPFGRYTLRRLLGRGGMGRVYLAHDPHLDRLVALKMPNPVEVAGWRPRFLAEARAAATLTHPNVCPVYDVGEIDGQPYLTMAYIEGETLAAKLQREGPLPPAAAVELVGTVARAMHEAHRRGIVHRDLKPANLMLDSAGRPVVMDFGLAVRSTAADDLRLTLTGVALGTPAYMPPEQAGGEHDSVGPPSDVYSLGVVLFELVTGRVPFRAKSFGKLLSQIERDAPPRPGSLNPAVDEALEAVILKALAKSPTDRFAAAGDLADALDRYRQGDRYGLVSLYSKPYLIPDATGEYLPSPSRFTTVGPPRSRRRSWWLAGAAALLLAAAGAAVYVETDYGQIVVHLSDPGAKVEVRVNGQEATLAVEGGRPVRVRAGKGQKLEITGDGFETVAESFDLKRGDVHVARVTLKPKGDVAKAPPKPKDDPAPPPPKPKDPVVEPRKKDVPKPEKKAPPKPVPYPKQPTLAETPGWQIYADATKDEMQAWLDARKKAGHSVVWLDAHPVGDKPVFSAVAALDDRQPKWTAMLDVPSAEAGDTNALRKRIPTEQHSVLAMSGYGVPGDVRAAILWRAERRSWAIGAGEPLGANQQGLAAAIKEGMSLRVHRPYPIGDVVLANVYLESGTAEKTPYADELSAADLAAFVAKQRADGFQITSVAGFVKDGTPAYAAVARPNPKNGEWHAEWGLPADKLAESAKVRRAQGFRPDCVTAYPFDGAVRYCVVWVKEPPKPVPYPKQPTLVELPGWQALADASKDEMQTWLDDRKKAGHSVTWLDAFAVDGKVAYAAVAALDGRRKDWVAVLDAPAADLATPAGTRKWVDPDTHTLVAVAGFVHDDTVRVAFLCEPGEGEWSARAMFPAAVLEQVLPIFAKSGIEVRQFRAAPGIDGREAYTLGGGIVSERRTAVATAIAADALAGHLAAAREKGQMPLSISACPADGQVRYAVAAVRNTEKFDWQFAPDLTADAFKERTASLGKEGYRVASVTGYAWDGAVRYCAVWVKEPPKPVKYPGGPTLVETPGWQALADATKDEMQTWLDDRKKAGHSVTWLDCYEVAGKPVFSAVAALDNRHTGWTAMLGVPGDPASMAKRLDLNKNRVVSISGYASGDEVASVFLWHTSGKRWAMDPSATEEFLDRDLKPLLANGFVVRVLRRYPVGNAARMASYSESAVGVRNAHAYGLTPAELAALLTAERDKNFRPLSVSASLKDGSPVFTAVLTPNPEKWEWEVDRDLTAADLKTKAAELAPKGFRPESVTAYGYDGAVRYCAVWVKEPPKGKEPAKKP